MRILIISRTPWNIENSFGNTFSNLFCGVDDVQIFHMCCQKGQTKRTEAEKTIQLSEKEIIKNGIDCGEIFTINQHIEEVYDFDMNRSDRTYKSIKAKRPTIILIARDIIWKATKWKKSKRISKFLEEANPDVIYIPIYNSWYMCDIQKYICETLNVPVVGHISDDVYSYPNGYMASPLVYVYKYILRKKIRTVVSKCSYLEVFAKNMALEYAKIFNKKCYIIGKGLTNKQIKSVGINCREFSVETPIKFIYTGNLGGERWKVIEEIGKNLDKLKNEFNVVLEIYSSTVLTEKMKSALGKYKTIEYKGSVSYDRVKEIQKEADVLVHVESFSKKSICETRMSFSTKIIDYLCTGNILLAIGPSEVNSISTIKDNGMGIVVDDLKNMEQTIKKLLQNKYDISEINLNVVNYLDENRKLDKIQEGIMNRLKVIVNKEKEQK